MRSVYALAMVLSLSGCAGYADIIQQTAPGHALPGGLSVCNERDGVGRCKAWSNPGEVCVNPNGLVKEPFTVPCSSIKK